MYCLQKSKPRPSQEGVSTVEDGVIDTKVSQGWRRNGTLIDDAGCDLEPVRLLECKLANILNELHPMTAEHRLDGYLPVCPVGNTTRVGVQ